MTREFQESKKELRRAAKNRRKGLPVDAISRSVCRNLSASGMFQDVTHVFAFYPKPDEIGPLALIAEHPEKRWHLPRITAPGEMTFYRYRPDDPLERHAYGFMEPPLTAEKAVVPDQAEPVLVLVPGLLFDRSGHRLGYGQGYYDRFFATANRPVWKVGLSAETLLVEQLPVEAWDIPLDAVVTEAATYRFGS